MASASWPMWHRHGLSHPASQAEVAYVAPAMGNPTWGPPGCLHWPTQASVGTSAKKVGSSLTSFHLDGRVPLESRFGLGASAVARPPPLHTTAVALERHQMAALSPEVWQSTVSTPPLAQNTPECGEPPLQISQIWHTGCHP